MSCGIPGIPIVYAGAVAPECVTFEVSASSSGIDLTTISSAELRLSRRGPSFQPDTHLTWASTIVSATAGLLRGKHTFAEGETTQTGVYNVLAVLTDGSGGVVRADLGVLEIKTF